MSTLAIAATAALALAAVAAKGSSARAPKPDLGAPPSWLTPEAQGVLEQLEAAYGVKIVAAPRAVYLLAPPARLRALLQPPAAAVHRRLLVSAGMSPSLARSYAGDATHWDGLQSVVAALLGQASVRAPGLDWSDLGAIPVPAPGHPPGPVWSVSKRAMVEGKAPKPFRFCDLPAVPMGSPRGPVLLELPKVQPPLFLSHGVTIDGLEHARACGGLLWPSFALTWRVPQSYGDLLFLADTSVISQILKPTGRPSALKHAYLAATDIWSPTVSDLEKHETEIDAQRVGGLYRGLQDGLVSDMASRPSSLDLVGGFSSFGNEDAALTDRVESVPKLAAHMRAILAAHSGDDDFYLQRLRNDQIWPYRYPYAELKIVGRVEVRAMPLCLYPEALAHRVVPQLDAMGFCGFRVPFSWSGGPRSTWSSDAELELAWATAATAALLRWAEAPCAAPGNVEIGSVAKQAGSYHPLLRLGRTAELGPAVRC